MLGQTDIPLSLPESDFLSPFSSPSMKVCQLFICFIYVCLVKKMTKKSYLVPMNTLLGTLQILYLLKQACLQVQSSGYVWANVHQAFCKGLSELLIPSLCAL